MVYAKVTEYLLDNKEKEFQEVADKLDELNKGAQRSIKIVDDHYVYITYREGINTQFEEVH